MMAPEPLRSAMSVGLAEDTSLAVPSDNKLRSGQQRVLDQVHSIKRSKSKKSGRLSPSPTSPLLQPLTTFTEFGSFKFSPSKANGTFSRNNSTMSAAYNKSVNTQKTRSMSTKTIGGRYMSTSGVWEQQINSSTWPKSPNGLKPSRSDPTLAPSFSVVPAPVMRAKGQMAQGQSTLQTRVNRHSVSSVNNSNLMTSSQTRMEGKMGTIKASKIEQKSATNTAMNMQDLNLKDAVEFLSHPEESFQQYGATFIQSATFNDEGTKSEVSQLGGIPALVTLLRSTNPGVSQAAAGALRNLVFKDNKNKLEVQHCGGVGKALQLLKETDSTETQKQITGLLWNLSSDTHLRPELISTAMPVLTENVVVPFTSWSDNTVTNHIDPYVFHCATGCLRNLSSGESGDRQAMRKCPGLIDSLMRYLQSCVAEENPDDQSVENSACILHNLTYDLEKECPEGFSNFFPHRNSELENRKSPTVGCFSPKSSKVQKEFRFDTQAMLNDDTPSGVKWLSHPKAMETYLSLLGSSQKDATLEACCGALQNLTAGKQQGSDAVSHFLVQKFRALYQISPLLKSPNKKLQKTVMSLLGNMSRNSSLQSSMAKQILPQLTNLLSSGPGGMGDETIAAACNTARKLLMADGEVSKKVISSEMVNSLSTISNSQSLPKGSRAASVLLHSLWNEKNLQSAVKRLGLEKSTFVNKTISDACEFLQSHE